MPIHVQAATLPESPEGSRITVLPRALPQGAVTVKWIIVAFNHPESAKSVLYRQGLGIQALLAAVERAANDGANLMSIRGVK